MDFRLAALAVHYTLKMSLAHVELYGLVTKDHTTDALDILHDQFESIVPSCKMANESCNFATFDHVRFREIFKMTEPIRRSKFIKLN